MGCRFLIHNQLGKDLSIHPCLGICSLLLLVTKEVPKLPAKLAGPFVPWGLQEPLDTPYYILGAYGQSASVGGTCTGQGNPPCTPLGRPQTQRRQAARQSQFPSSPGLHWPWEGLKPAPHLGAWRTATITSLWHGQSGPNFSGLIHCIDMGV